MGSKDNPKNIRIIVAPKTDLSEWLTRLDHTVRAYVESRVGRLMLILDIKTRVGIVHALTHFWSPDTSTFILGKHELTPTLEEYSMLVGKPVDTELISPPIGLDPAMALADFLKIKVEEIRKVLKAGRGSCPFSFVKKCFDEASPIQKGKVFLLAFFGMVIFPYFQNFLNPHIAFVVQQICDGRNLVHAILAETFISLTKFKQEKGNILHSSADLLLIWFLSHIRPCKNLVSVEKIRNFSHPIIVFKNKQREIPDYHFSDWLLLLTDPRPRGFRWQASWFQVESARLASGGAKPIPLLGFTGATEYYPLRVARQYGVVQTLPPPLEADRVQFDFTQSIPEHEQAVITVRSLWDFCRPTKLKLPTKVLSGDEKAYHATALYIKKHVIPEAIRPKIPTVSVTATHRAEKEELKRKLEQAEGTISKLTTANKRLKDKLASQKS